MRSHNGSNATPLDPPLFWLDSIFNDCFILAKKFSNNMVILEQTDSNCF
jgi:hypothetical protein